MWFREDLRVTDNMALHYACTTANDGVIAVFIITPEVWQKHDTAACKVEFMLRGLHELQAELSQLNIPLLIRYATNDQQIPAILLKLAQQTHTARLFFNKQYEIDESRRDQKVTTRLEQHGLKVRSYHDQVIAEPGYIVNQKSEYYKIFTPFKKAWLTAIQTRGYEVYPKPKPQKLLILAHDPLPKKINGFHSEIAPELWPAGEQIAQKRLNDFVTQKITDYQPNRDFPAKNNTSRLSPYLNSGMISIRSCLKIAQETNNGLLFLDDSGASTWINELIWREFYRHILVAFPRVSMHR
ncbi:MAG: phrB, partial [Gammaproteobacteria bacterium]|nr:phrB [Gammaproteobacteria bacterium]